MKQGQPVTVQVAQNNLTIALKHTIKDGGVIKDLNKKTTTWAYSTVIVKQANCLLFRKWGVILYSIVFKFFTRKVRYHKLYSDCVARYIALKPVQS